MVGATSWRRTAAYILGLSVCAAALFASLANHPRAGGLLQGVRDRFRSLSHAADANPLRRPATSITGKSSRAYALEMDALRRDPHLLLWGARHVDPTKDELLPQGVMPELAAPRARVADALLGGPMEGLEYWVCQYEGPAGPYLAFLQKLQIETLGFIPNAAYLVRVTPDQVAQIQANPDTRWMGRELPWFKLDGGALKTLTAGDDTSSLPLDPKGLLQVQVDLHANVDPFAYEPLVKALPGVEIIYVKALQVTDRGGFLVAIDPRDFQNAIVEIAGMRDVANVTLQPPPVLMNDQSVWQLQSGLQNPPNPGSTNYDITAPLFAHGITGRGMIGSDTDDGQENDLCQFRYTNTVADTGYELGPSADSFPANPCPDEGGDISTRPIRSRDRKVVAYYLQRNAAAYSSDIQHGTTTSACMLADNNTVLAARPFIRDVGERQNVRPFRTAGQWTVGQDLRPDLIPVVDDPATDTFSGSNPFGTNIEHHQTRDGMAPGAQEVMQDIGDAAGNLVNMAADLLVYQSHCSGAVTSNHSYGALTACLDCYAGEPFDADDAMWQRRDMLVFVAAGNLGNDGPSSIPGGIAHSKSAVVVGASERGDSASCNGTPCPLGTTTFQGNDVADFSSRGPKSGGALAPTLCTPGIVITPTAGGIPVSPEDGTGSGDGGCGSTTGGGETGTSFACPTAAGIALLVGQYFRDGFYPTGVATPADAMRPTNALVRAVLVNSCRDMLGGRTDDTGLGQAHRPSNGQGWGLPRLDDTLYFQGDPRRVGPDANYWTQRARFGVLTDTPNGLTGTAALAPEPGGKTRDQIVKAHHPALSDGAVHEYVVNVINDVDGDGVPDFNDLANELRITMAYTDERGGTNTAPVMNDLDLEVIGPGPDGILQSSSGANLLGDDVVYRTNPLSTAWNGGFSVASTTRRLQATRQPFDQTLPDKDPLNTVENVFIKPQEVFAGQYRIRVIGFSVPGGVGTNNGRPNFVLGDRPLVFDTNGDTVNDLDFEDVVQGANQGYALIMSGNFTSTQGLISLNQSTFTCAGDQLTLNLTDENGAAAPEPGCTGVLTATLTTTTPSPAFPADFETVNFTGTQPTFRSLNPVTGAQGFQVQVVSDPTAVIHGDGIIEIAHGETIIAHYVDSNPCGGEAFAQASVSCQPAVADSGFTIEDGCDYTVTGNPASGVTPDAFLDMGELDRYTVFFVNNGSVDMHDCRVTLTPDPTDPYAGLVHVLTPVVNVGLAPPGRRSNATFLVQLDAAGIPPLHQMNFLVGVTSPLDGLLFAGEFTQVQVLEADVESHRYDTRDPNGELFGFDRFRRLKHGVDEAAPPPNPPQDYVVNDPMWFDPDAAGATNCDQTRDRWPSRTQPPAGCPPAAWTGNPWDPWDFDDSNEGFQEYGYNGDGTTMGSGGVPFFFSWRSAPNGGGCGWEDQVHNEIATHGNPLPAGHPDVFTQPWGIWHTGAINATQNGPFAGNVSDSQGAPFYDAPTGDRDPLDHTILWDSRPVGGADNRTGQWCASYYENPSLDNYYRSILLPPRLFRVHRLTPEYKVEFDELRFFTRMDGHDVDDSNWVAASWMIGNQPVDPDNAPATPSLYSWGDWPYVVNIYTDKVAERWDVDDNDIVENIRQPNVDFPDLTFEDVFGPASDSWNMAFGFTHAHFSGRRGRGQYGWGFDDVSFVWRETREVADQSSCAALPGGQPAIITFDEQRYNACDGVLGITLIDPSQTLPAVAVAVTSSAEKFEIAMLQFNAADGRYEGTMAFTTDPRQDAVGVLLVSGGTIDVGGGADTVGVEYDPDELYIAGPASQAQAEELADWQDSDGNGINDDTDGDGVPDAQQIENPPNPNPHLRERRDTTVINCTSGRLFYIKHRLTQVPTTPGDNDRFADHGETQLMALTLVSSVGADLDNVDVRISTTDPIFIINDTVHMDTLPGNSVPIETPQLFEFCVPASYRTTSLANPRTITFRIDVTGTNTSNLNQFSTAGESFNTFLPLQAVLIADVDEVVTPLDYTDVRPPGRPADVDGDTIIDRPLGTFLEGFEGAAAGAYGLDHPFIASTAPGVQPGILQDTTLDTRFGASGNGGFCTECDFQTDCAVPAACAYQFSMDATTGYPTTLRNAAGLNPLIYGAEWAVTQAPNGWAYRGLGAYKWGDPASNNTQADQHYSKGQYISVALPPLRLTSDPSVTPELSWWHIVDVWNPFFTSGLVTPIDGCVVEIAASAVGTVDSGAGADNRNRSTWALIDPNVARSPNTAYPLNSFRRLSPYEGVYDYETDALNSCRALYCRYKHPVFMQVGAPDTTPTDIHASDNGTPGSWYQTKVDLSDYKGMEVIIQFSAEVMQDLDIQPGNMGWFIDNVVLTGVSNRIAIRAQAQDLTGDPCPLTANFVATDPACFGSEVQFLDQHSGVGLFQVAGDPNPGQPWPIEYEWFIGTLTIPRGLGGVIINPPIAGVFGTYDNPRVNLQTAAGVAAPGNVNVTMRVYQNGSLVDTDTRSIVYKDAPVPVITATPALLDGTTTFTGSATFNAALDPTRSLVWEWDFGDGSPIDSSGPVVQHIYTSQDSDPGTAGNQPFTVTARVYDEDGCVGTTTRSISVAATPTFGNPTMTFVDDCAGAATNDGNADLNEYITVNIGVQNTSTTAATGVVGYLSSPDLLVEITGGAADYGNMAGSAIVSRPFSFIRRDGGLPAPTCLVIPFRLTMVSNGGSVLQTLDFGYTMGNASEVNYSAPVAGPQSFCPYDPATPGSGETIFNVTSPSSGCLDGLRMQLTLTSLNSATIDGARVQIITPDFQSIDVLTEGYGPNTHGARSGAGGFVLDFEFGNDASGVVVDTGGVVRDYSSSTEDTLEDTIQASLASQLTGTSMIGAQPWQIRVSTTVLGQCSSGTWSATLNQFKLEGNSSADLEIGTEPACASCFTGSTPVFQGVRADCSGPRVLFNPAIDTSVCGGVPDVTYQLYGSRTAGQLGTAVTVASGREYDPAVTTCSAQTVLFPDEIVAERRLPNATMWEVCNVTDVFWTVIAVDGGGQRFPNISAPTDAVPAGFQTTRTICINPITPGVFALVKANTTTLNLWLVPPVGVPTLPTITPPGNATEYRLLRGTIPSAGGVLKSMATRITGGPCGPTPGGQACRDGAYDHNAVNCAFGTTTTNVSAELTRAGSYYYFVAGNNSGGCAGMGYRALPGGAPGTLDETSEPIPGFGPGVVPNPACPTPCVSP